MYFLEDKKTMNVKWKEWKKISKKEDVNKLNTGAKTEKEKRCAEEHD